MIIRECQFANLADCANLLKQAYSKPPYNEKWDIDNAFSYLKRFWNIEPQSCFVALESDSLIGDIFAYSYPWHNERLYYIQELFVKLNHRRKGIARELLNSLCYTGKKINVWLVANENAEATSFYKKVGFSKKGPYKFFNGTITT